MLIFQMPVWLQRQTQATLQRPNSRLQGATTSDSTCEEEATATRASDATMFHRDYPLKQSMCEN
jgi:hypothetical protein